MSYQPPPSQLNPQAQQAPAQYSPDGRWYWDGQRWVPVAAPGPAWAKPFESPEGRATAAVVLVGICAAGFGVFVIGDTLDLVAAVTGAAAFQAAAAIVLLISLLVYLPGLVGGAITVPMWIHRTYRNLPALGAQGMRSSPAWGAGCWFVPIVSFWIPLRFVRELSAKSGGGDDPVPQVVSFWWAAWIGGGILSYLSIRLMGASQAASDIVGVVGDVGFAAAGVLFIQIVRYITRRQIERARQLQGY